MIWNRKARPGGPRRRYEQALTAENCRKAAGSRGAGGGRRARAASRSPRRGQRAGRRRGAGQGAALAGPRGGSSRSRLTPPSAPSGRLEVKVKAGSGRRGRRSEAAEGTPRDGTFLRRLLLPDMKGASGPEAAPAGAREQAGPGSRRGAGGGPRGGGEGAGQGPPHSLALLAVVQHDGVVVAARDDRLAVGAEVEAVDLVRVLAEHLGDAEASQHAVG